MGWSYGFDPNLKRDVGYGVPAICDQPGCTTEIDRGLGYVCGGEPFGGDHGCGLMFCSEHLIYDSVPVDPDLMDEPKGGRLGGRAVHIEGGKLCITVQRCERCCAGLDPFKPKPDVEEWIRFKLTDESWQEWRDENPDEVRRMEAAFP